MKLSNLRTVEVAVTVIALLSLGIWLYHLQPWGFFQTGRLNEFGDFLAGIFAPLAFVWLAAAVVTQRQELKLAHQQFTEAQGVNRAQMETIEAQNVLLQKQHTLSEESANKTYRLNLFEQRYAVYDLFVEFGRKHRPTHYMRANVDELFSLRRRASFLFLHDIPEYIYEIQNSIEEHHERYSKPVNGPGTFAAPEDPNFRQAMEAAAGLISHQFTLADRMFAASLWVSDKYDTTTADEWNEIVKLK